MSCGSDIICGGGTDSPKGLPSDGGGGGGNCCGGSYGGSGGWLLPGGGGGGCVKSLLADENNQQDVECDENDDNMKEPGTTPTPMLCHPSKTIKNIRKPIISYNFLG